MANEEINEYTRIVTSPDDDARFDMDDWDGAAFISTQIKYSDLKLDLGTGHLGNTNLTQTDNTRTFTFPNDEPTTVLMFRNDSLENALIINAQCDVYNHGLANVVTNLMYGLNAARGITGDRNTVNGVNAIAGGIAVDDNTAIGYNAGRYLTGTTDDNDEGTESIYLGSQTYPLNSDDINSIIIGFLAVGKGSNTVVIGNGDITDNYFTGNVFATSLEGVGDRNVVADVDGKLKIGTALSLIGHYDTFASFPVTGSVETIYIADDTDVMYIWDDDGNQYVRVSAESIYYQDGIIEDTTRFVRLNQDTDGSTLSFENASGNPIVVMNGQRDVYLDNIKAPTGLNYSVGITDTGQLYSYAIPQSDGSTWQNIEIGTDGQTVLTLSTPILGDALVYYDGNIQFDYTKTNNTTITLDEGKPAGMVIKIFG